MPRGNSKWEPFSIAVQKIGAYCYVDPQKDFFFLIDAK